MEKRSKPKTTCKLQSCPCFNQERQPMGPRATPFSPVLSSTRRDSKPGPEQHHSVLSSLQPGETANLAQSDSIQSCPLINRERQPIWPRVTPFSPVISSTRRDSNYLPEQHYSVLSSLQPGETANGSQINTSQSCLLFNQERQPI